MDMHDTWLDYSQAAVKLNIAESTLRRYGKQFEPFIEYKLYNKKRRLSPESVRLLARVAQMIQKGYTVLELKEVFEIERGGKQEPAEPQTPAEMVERSGVLVVEQTKLIQSLHAEMKAIREAEAAEKVELREKIEQLNGAIEKMAEELRRIRELQARPWYKRIFK